MTVGHVSGGVPDRRTRRSKFSMFCGFCQNVVGYGSALPARRKCRTCGVMNDFPKHAESCPSGRLIGDCNCSPEWKSSSANEGKTST